ncbi:UNVERIFIED_CONTAM: hypothetical protein KB581_01815 [Streptococcus canis]
MSLGGPQTFFIEHYKKNVISAAFLVGHNILETSNGSQKLVIEILDELQKFEVRT